MLLPQLGDLVDGLWPWVPLFDLGFSLGVLLLGQITDRLVLRMFKGAGKWGVEVLQSLLSYAVLVVLFDVVMSTHAVVLTSVAVSVVFYLISTPLFKRLDAKAFEASA
ncbi:hypothetical protein [Glutamicibacter arilaitensis]|uniref:hypothetical protein n=1 Tax=Glutamicibacter arilaitensis TaxID=256701 RepID=UPI00384EC9AD